jgi:hypothetical protein
MVTTKEMRSGLWGPMKGLVNNVNVKHHMVSFALWEMNLGILAQGIQITRSFPLRDLLYFPTCRPNAWHLRLFPSITSLGCCRITISLEQHRARA